MMGGLWLLLVVGTVACQATQDMDQGGALDVKETGKIYFSGTDYTINLIPHAILIGLAVLAFVFLYGGDLTGSSTDASATYGAPATGYGAPATGYGTPEASYAAPSTGYGTPEASYAAPAPAYTAPASSYAAPSTVYAALSRYYDPYEQQQTNSGLASWDPVNGQTVQVPTNFNPDLNPYNLPEPLADQGKRKRRRRALRRKKRHN